MAETPEMSPFMERFFESLGKANLELRGFGSVEPEQFKINFIRVLFDSMLRGYALKLHPEKDKSKIPPAELEEHEKRLYAAIGKDNETRKLYSPGNVRDYGQMMALLRAVSRWEKAHSPDLKLAGSVGGGPASV
ncbi:MAG: hypothetical protein V1835_07310 [Candidatus Micrarchaeota archaeon]